MKSKIIINVKKLISILLCTISISSTIPSSLLNSTAFALNDNDITCQSYTVQNFEELQDAITHAQKGETILLSKDITIPKDKQLCINNKDITITSYGNTKTIKLDTYYTEAIKFNFFRIENNSKVNLENITIDLSTGTHYISITNAINVYNSTLNINSGTTIKNFRSTHGAAIYSNHSKISLNECNICDLCNICDFGSCSTAIALENKSDFKQNGGKISRCYQAISSCDSNIEQTNVTISNCKAGYGGAIYSQRSHIEQTNVTISNCKADYGGAICAIYFSSTSLSNTSIDSCQAKNGGAIYSQSSHIDQKNVTISNCKAQQGGAIYSSQSSHIDQKDVTISNCKADYGGAICAIYFSSTSLSNTSIDSCQAKNGGAIAAYSNSCLSLVNSKIDNCKSENENIGKGNAIYTDYNAKLKIDKCEIRFDATCKINTNKDNGEQKYKYKGIFDEKLDKNNTPKVDNNNPQPFQINSPNCYTCNNNEYNNPKRIKVFGTGTPGYIVKISKYNALRNKYKDIGSAKVNDKGQWSADIVADADLYYNHLSCNLRFVHQKIDNDASSTEKCQNISFWLRSKYDNIPRLYHYETEDISNICIWPLFVTHIKTSSPIMSTFIDRECKENNHKLQEYTQNINNIIFGVYIPDIQPIIKNIEYLKTDQLYCLNKPIPKNAKWIPAPESSYYYSHDNTGYYHNHFSTKFKIDLEEGKLNDQFYVYCKLTDIFNNIRYARFNSHVLIHKDIEVKEDKITEANVTYKKLTKKDKEFSVTLNKNTLCEKDEIVKVIDYKTEKSLQKNTDYTIEGNKITIKQNYLDKLKDTTDNYLTIYYYPAGKTDCGKTFHQIHISTKKPDKIKITNYEYSNSTDPTISGTGEKGCLVSITNENKEIIGTTIVAENGKWQLTTSKLPKDTNHKISIFQTDLEANTTSDPLEYIPIITFNNLQKTYTYGCKPIAISLNGYSGTSKITYESDNIDVAKITKNGQIIIKRVGTFHITAKTGNRTLKTSDNITVLKCPVKISGIVAESKTYDGTTDATIDKKKAHIERTSKDDNLDDDLDNNLEFDCTAHFNDKNAGENKDVTVEFNLNSENYVLDESQEKTFKADIYQCPVIIENLKAKNKLYNGKMKADIDTSKAKIKGKVEGDDLDDDLDFNYTANFNNQNAGKDKDVMVSFKLTGKDEQNYIIDKFQQTTFKATILKKPLKVECKIQNKQFDGNKNAQFAEKPTLEGVIKNDKGRVTLKNGTPHFKDYAVGIGKKIIFNPPFDLEGIRSKNYYIDQQSLDKITADIYENPSPEADIDEDSSPEIIIATKDKKQSYRGYNPNIKPILIKQSFANVTLSSQDKKTNIYYLISDKKLNWDELSKRKDFSLYDGAFFSVNREPNQPERKSKQPVIQKFVCAKSVSSDKNKNNNNNNITNAAIKFFKPIKIG